MEGKTEDGRDEEEGKEEERDGEETHVVLPDVDNRRYHLRYEGEERYMKVAITHPPDFSEHCLVHASFLRLESSIAWST